MKPFVWVRMIFRAMGVLFIGMSLPQCFQFASQLVSYSTSPQMRASWPADFGQILYTLGWGLGGYLQLGLGIYLLFYGKRLREWCMRDEEGHCPRCDYELGAGISICPECGLPLAKPPQMPPRPESP
jgi:hypothetical protein